MDQTLDSRAIAAARGQAFYFGCWDGPGHFFFDVFGRNVGEHALPPGFPWRDGGHSLCLRPQGVRGDILPRGSEVQGLAQIFRENGWTALAFWDRSVDTRMNCWSTFFLEGVLTFDETIERSRVLFPSIWARFPFEVRLAPEHAFAETTVFGRIRDELRNTRAELERLKAAINTPETEDFLSAVKNEAIHQRERWGAAHDAEKTAADWFWLVGFLAGKALHSFTGGDVGKAKHHLVATAAALSNWHAAVMGKSDMQPGTVPPGGD